MLPIIDINIIIPAKNRLFRENREDRFFIAVTHPPINISDAIKAKKATVVFDMPFLYVIIVTINHAVARCNIKGRSKRKSSIEYIPPINAPIKHRFFDSGKKQIFSAEKSDKKSIAKF